MQLDQMLRAQKVLGIGLDEMGLTLNDHTRGALIEYVALLVIWNRIYNLTAIRDPLEIVRRHVLDALSVLPYLCGTRLLDVGTGAGLPGLVLALARADIQSVLLDSNAKKVRFCRQAVAELKPKNVEVLHMRVEEYRPTQPFPTVIARAYGSLTKLFNEAYRLVAPDGCLLAMKGVFPSRELAEIGPWQARARVIRLRISGSSAQRHLVIFGPNPMLR